jgi:putative DNA primase/helicase
MVELEEFADRPPYFEGALAKAFPPIEPSQASKEIDFAVNSEPLDLLASIAPGNWHAPMRSFVAHCVSIGLPDWAIVEMTRSHLDDASNPSDVVALIESARKKWTLPDPGKKQRNASTIGLGELFAIELPPRELIFGPWLASQGLAMIYAQRGIGKTYFALNVAYAIATGGQYLGWTAPERRRVLYVDGEMPAVTMQERARAIAGTNTPEDIDSYFKLVTPDLQDDALPDLSSAAGQAALAPLLEGVDVLVLDNLSTLCRSGIENESESWLPVQNWLLGLRRRGMTIILVHHAAKTGQQRGTSRREDVLDTVIKLKRPIDYDATQGARFEVHFEKSRGFVGAEARSIEASLRMNDFGFSEWIYQTLEDLIDNQINELTEAGMSQRDIGKEVGLSKTAVQKRQKRASDAA